MKKSTIILCCLLLAGTAIEAQDTVHATAPRSNYFYNDWAHGDTLNRGGFRLGGDFDEKAVAYHTTDSLQVHGLAISLRIRDYLNENPGALIADTTMDSIYCFVRLYKAVGDSLHVLAEQRIHMRDTPVSYILALGQRGMRDPRYSIEPEPVYECFFDNPVTVTDSFYVGLAFDKYGQTYDTVAHQVARSYRYEFACTGFLGSQDRSILKDPITIAFRYAHDYNGTHGTPGSWKIDVKYRPNPYYFMYAIVDTAFTDVFDSTIIPIDTTVVPTDTTAGIGKVDMVNRYVSVSPNPAGDRATVLSSFGLTAIEAYDPQGRKLYSAPAEGLKATLDVGAWPRGTVLLHIHTPAGTAVKKLLLR